MQKFLPPTLLKKKRKAFTCLLLKATRASLLITHYKASHQSHINREKSN